MPLAAQEQEKAEDILTGKYYYSINIVKEDMKKFRNNTDDITSERMPPVDPGYRWDK